MTFKFKDIGGVPSNPPAGYVGLYCNGGILYWIDSAGVTTSISSGTGDLKADGTIPLTANWDVGAFKITANQLESDVASGTAPLIVASTTEVANLTSEWASKGLSLVVAVRNESGALLTKGKAVYISGYSVGSDIALVDLARSDSGTTMPCEGIILADIANNATGWMVVNGRIEDVDTSSFSVGDELYIDASTAGALTATEPTGANIPQDVATCLRSHATLGVLEVHVFQARLTAAELKTKYESNADTNAYTDAEQTKVGYLTVTGAVDLDADTAKLAGIEALADVTDATNVAAAGAVMDSDISAAEGFLRKTGAGAYEAIKSNLAAVTDPGATDDSAAGYAIGSVWINTVTNIPWFCVDATATAALWSSGGGSGGLAVLYKTGAYTAVDADYIFANSVGGAFTLTLPATPGTGESVMVKDCGSAGTYNVTVARNGETIKGVAEDFIIDQNYSQAHFIYDGTTWQVSMVGHPDLISAYTVFVVYKEVNYTASSGERVMVGTDAGALTITLPASPPTGASVGVWDADNNAGTNNITIGRNGQTIDGVAADDTLDLDGGHFELVFDGTTWKRSFWAPGGITEVQASNIVGSVTIFTGTIADDDVWVYDFGMDIFVGSGIIGWNRQDLTTRHGTFTFRAASSRAECDSISSTGLAFTTGVLTGTTGADATITISAATDNKFYVENRSGNAANFIVTLNIGAKF